MIPVAFIWDNLTRLSGVTTWLLQCIDQLPAYGIDPYILDLGCLQGREVNIARWQHRIEFIPCSRRRSEAGWRKSIRKALARRDIRAVIFNEHRFGEDVMWSLPEGFPAANVLHADRPDEAYYRLAADLDRLLKENWCVSPSIARKFEPLFEASRRSRIHYLPLGVPLPGRTEIERYAGQTPLQLLYSGRISQKQKRILDLPAFCARMDTHGLSWLLHVVGDGPDMEALQQQIAPWVQAGHVVLHGAVPYERAMEIACDTHVLLLFSAYEGLPLSLLEAMARGNLPVVTDIESGISDILHEDVNARLFPVGQPADAADKVAELARDTARLQHLRTEAMMTATQFDQKPCMENYAARIRCLALSDDEASAIWKQPCPQVFRDRPLRCRLVEHLPGWMAGNE